MTREDTVHCRAHTCHVLLVGTRAANSLVGEDEPCLDVKKTCGEIKLSEFQQQTQLSIHAPDVSPSLGSAHTA